MKIKNDAGMRPERRRVPSEDLVPFEAMDRSHPDHTWWVGPRGWCFDPDCPDHAYGRPSGNLALPTEGIR